jgi:hypothetical protein
MARLFLCGARCARFMILTLVCLSVAHAQRAALDTMKSSMMTGIDKSSVPVEAEPPILKFKPADILKLFIATENKFRETLSQYTFRREVILQTVGEDGQVNGEYIRHSQFVLDDGGRRIERVLYHPKSTLRNLKITKEDIQDLAGSQLFGFDASSLDSYNLTFVGTEVLDSQEMYVVDISPKVAPNPHRMKERYFVGRIWVDPRSFQIVKARGKTEPQGKQRFPVFETWRGQMGGPSLFPTRTLADDTLHFPSRDIHYRVIVKYTNYKKFRSTVTLIESDRAD